MLFSLVVVFIYKRIYQYIKYVEPTYCFLITLVNQVLVYQHKASGKCAH